MTVYIIAKFTIHDRSEYDIYESGFAEVFAKFDGKMLSVDEEPLVLSGDWQATGRLLLSFPQRKAL